MLITVELFFSYFFTAGYVYVLFECERSCKALLQSCTQDYNNVGEYYYKISSKRLRNKEIFRNVI